MARTYDIVEKLREKNKRPTIKVDETHEFTINTSKNTAIFLQATAQDEKLNEDKKMQTMIESALGKEALTYIESLDLSMDAYSLIIEAIMAAIANMDLEYVEKEANKEKGKFRK